MLNILLKSNALAPNTQNAQDTKDSKETKLFVANSLTNNTSGTTSSAVVPYQTWDLMQLSIGALNLSEIIESCKNNPMLAIAAWNNSDLKEKIMNKRFDGWGSIALEHPSIFEELRNDINLLNSLGDNEKVKLAAKYPDACPEFIRQGILDNISGEDLANLQKIMQNHLEHYNSFIQALNNRIVNGSNLITRLDAYKSLEDAASASFDEMTKLINQAKLDTYAVCRLVKHNQILKSVLQNNLHNASNMTFYWKLANKDTEFAIWFIENIKDQNAEFYIKHKHSIELLLIGSNNNIIRATLIRYPQITMHLSGKDIAEIIQTGTSVIDNFSIDPRLLPKYQAYTALIDKEQKLDEKQIINHITAADLTTFDIRSLCKKQIHIRKAVLADEKCYFRLKYHWYELGILDEEFALKCCVQDKVSVGEYSLAEFANKWPSVRPILLRNQRFVTYISGKDLAKYGDSDPTILNIILNDTVLSEKFYNYQIIKTGKTYKETDLPTVSSQTPLIGQADIRLGQDYVQQNNYACAKVCFDRALRQQHPQALSFLVNLAISIKDYKTLTSYLIQIKQDRAYDLEQQCYETIIAAKAENYLTYSYPLACLYVQQRPVEQQFSIEELCHDFVTNHSVTSLLHLALVRLKALPSETLSVDIETDPALKWLTDSLKSGQLLPAEKAEGNLVLLQFYLAFIETTKGSRYYEVLKDLPSTSTGNINMWMQVAKRYLQPLGQQAGVTDSFTELYDLFKLLQSENSNSLSHPFTVTFLSELLQQWIIERCQVSKIEGNKVYIKQNTENLNELTKLLQLPGGHLVHEIIIANIRFENTAIEEKRHEQTLSINVWQAMLEHVEEVINKVRVDITTIISFSEKGNSVAFQYIYNNIEYIVANILDNYSKEEQYVLIEILNNKKDFNNLIPKPLLHKKIKDDSIAQKITITATLTRFINAALEIETTPARVKIFAIQYLLEHNEKFAFTPAAAMVWDGSHNTKPSDEHESKGEIVTNGENIKSLLQKIKTATAFSVELASPLAVQVCIAYFNFIITTFNLSELAQFLDNYPVLSATVKDLVHLKLEDILQKDNYSEQDLAILIIFFKHAHVDKIGITFSKDTPAFIKQAVKQIEAGEFPTRQQALWKTLLTVYQKFNIVPTGLTRLENQIIEQPLLRSQYYKLFQPKNFQEKKSYLQQLAKFAYSDSESYTSKKQQVQKDVKQQLLLCGDRIAWFFCSAEESLLEDKKRLNACIDEWKKLPPLDPRKTSLAMIREKYVDDPGEKCFAKLQKIADSSEIAAEVRVEAWNYISKIVNDQDAPANCAFDLTKVATVREKSLSTKGLHFENVPLWDEKRAKPEDYFYAFMTVILVGNHYDQAYNFLKQNSKNTYANFYINFLEGKPNKFEEFINSGKKKLRGEGGFYAYVKALAQRSNIIITIPEPIIFKHEVQKQNTWWSKLFNNNHSVSSTTTSSTSSTMVSPSMVFRTPTSPPDETLSQRPNIPQNNIKLTSIPRVSNNGS